MGINPPAGTIARPAIGTGTATVQGTVTLRDEHDGEGPGALDGRVHWNE